MPLWQIYHSPDTFEDSGAKEAFARDITKMYTDLGLPAFYVVINFIQLPVEDTFVGGAKRTEIPFIRLVITHIAIHVQGNNAHYEATTARVDDILKLHIANKGYDWEYHIAETSRQLWKINGIIPPPFRSHEEQLWARANRAIPYDGAYHSMESTSHP